MNEQLESGLLEALTAEDEVAEARYRVLYNLGFEYGSALANELKGQSVGIACTPASTDSLVRGLIHGLKRSADSISVACFWNAQMLKHPFSNPFKRLPTEPAFLPTAPIQKMYFEPGMVAIDSLIVAEAVISDVLVVKTNITRLLQTSKPDKIFVVAPIMASNVESALRAEFPSDTADRIRYVRSTADCTREFSFPPSAMTDMPDLVLARRNTISRPDSQAAGPEL